MDFEKIKEFVLEKKIYFIVLACLVIGGILYTRNNKNDSVDNSGLVSQQKDKDESNFNKGEAKSQSMTSSSAPKKTTQQTTVTCDIAGAVKHPGVYSLKNGARLNDLLAAAGGVTKNAQLKSINRALLLKDQDQFYVPHKGERVELAPQASPASASTSQANSQTSSDSTNSNSSGEKININTATVQDLQKLSGIGEKRAEQIIEYREQSGGFKKLEDLTKISGIGEKTFDKLKDQLEL